MEKNKKDIVTFEGLMLDVMLLYIDGVLQQYGLTDKQALDIVANVTKLHKKTLIDLKQMWVEDLSKQMSGATDEILGALGHQSKR